jgi:hypothetical protein
MVNSLAEPFILINLTSLLEIGQFRKKKYIGPQRQYLL